MIAILGAVSGLKMPTFKLPNGNMPAIGYGTWLAEEGEVYEGTKAALKCGYRHIDEAWVYGNEAEVGKAIVEALEDGTIASRDELWVTSKLWQNFHRPELVREGCLDSMKKLGVDYLDLYLMHFPVAFVPGCTEATSADMMDDVPIEDTWLAMEKLVDEGLVRNSARAPITPPKGRRPPLHVVVLSLVAHALTALLPIPPSVRSHTRARGSRSL